MKKTLVAMSGGVDSSVALFLTKQQGYDCTGVTMKLISNDDFTINTEKSCCSIEDVEDARSVANSLDIPYYVFNFTADFSTQVIDRFVDAYENGDTPNPCIDCNRYMKFDKLFLRAKQLDIDYIVTGHYARVEYDATRGRYLLKKAVDATKDQSYVLYALTQEQLSHTLFPLGGLHKTQVRNIALENKFVNSKKRESQDICFVPDGDYAGFIENYSQKSYSPGNFIDKEGHILGSHKGIIRYTIGQRKGLGLSFKEPMYVCNKDLDNNTVTLCKENELYSKTLYATDFNWIAFEKCEQPIRIKAKVRYQHQEQDATAEQISEDTVKITFDEPQKAIASGQAVVLYDGDIVVGGGTIK